MRYLCLLTLVMLGFGCSSTTHKISEGYISKQLSLESPSVEYQYAAPWDAKRYEEYITIGESYIPKTLSAIQGGIIPHHLLAGYLDGAFFASLQHQKVDTLIIIGPNHFNRGIGPVATTKRDWKTVFGTVQTDTSLIQKLQQIGIVRVEEEVIDEEHSIYSVVPFISKLLPYTKIVVLTLPIGMDQGQLDMLIDEIDTHASSQSVIIGSVDFSHYQPLSVANFHDDRAENAIRDFSYTDILDLEVDSPETIYTVAKLMELRGAMKIEAVYRDNSAVIINNTEVTETTSYITPYYVMGLKEAVEPIATVLHVGDIMIDRSVALRIDEYGFDWLLEPLGGEERRFFRGIDKVIGNLEGPFANTRINTTKEIAFRFKPELVSKLKEWNFDTFTLANNHTYDMGKQGVVDTRVHLETGDIAFFGEQYAVNTSSLYFDTVRGLKIAYVGLNETNGGMDLDRPLELIRYAETHASTTIVTIHWGIEYRELSSAKQKDWAHQFIDNGADGVIGHHPHVVQEIEVYKNRPIFYSLGNFLFDQYFSVPTQQGISVGLVLESNFVRGAYIFPLSSSRSQVSYMPSKMRQSFMKSLIDRSRLSKYTIDNYYLNLSYGTK